MQNREMNKRYKNEFWVIKRGIADGCFPKIIGSADSIPQYCIQNNLFDNITGKIFSDKSLPLFRYRKIRKMVSPAAENAVLRWKAESDVK